MKLCYIDIETTGVDRTKHEIHQISGLIEIDGKVKQVFDFKIRPSEKCVYDPEALRVNQLSVDDLQSPTRYSHRQAYQLFSTMLNKYVNKYNKSDKFFFVGYNAHFDKDCMYDWFVNNGDNYFFSFFWGNHIDIMVLATTRLLEQRHLMENFQLTTVCNYLKIQVPETELPDGTSVQDKQAHDAIYDILLTRELYLQVKSNTPVIPSTMEMELSPEASAFFPSATAEIEQPSTIKKSPVIGSKGYPVLDWDSTFPFKKYRGHTVRDIFEADVQYLDWCINNTQIEFTQEIFDDIRKFAELERAESSKGCSRDIKSKSYTSSGNDKGAIADKSIDHFIDSQDISDINDYPF